MSRAASTAIVLTIGLAVSAAVAVTVFAQKNTPASGVSPETSPAQPLLAAAPAGMTGINAKSIAVSVNMPNIRFFIIFVLLW